MEELKVLSAQGWKRQKEIFTPLVVDEAVIKLTKNVTLPMEDSATFKDILERRIDLDLRNVYLLAGAVC